MGVPRQTSAPDECRAPGRPLYLSRREKHLRLPAAPAWSFTEAFALGFLGAAALLAIGYGLGCGIGLVGHWGTFQAGIERLIQ
jgi:hypothetical protein